MSYEVGPYVVSVWRGENAIRAYIKERTGFKRRPFKDIVEIDLATGEEKPAHAQNHGSVDAMWRKMFEATGITRELFIERFRPLAEGRAPAGRKPGYLTSAEVSALFLAKYEELKKAGWFDE